MTLKCRISGHETTSGEEKIEEKELWYNVCVYYCEQCDEIVINSSKGDAEEQETVVDAANRVLENENQYNEWTVEAANKAVAELG